MDHEAPLLVIAIVYKGQLSTYVEKIPSHSAYGMLWAMGTIVFGLPFTTYDSSLLITN